MAFIHTLIGNVKGPAGAAGQNFEYKKTYASVSAMNNDYSGTDTSVGDYVIIAANDLSDADNGKVYRKGNSSWVYVVQVAGPRGAKGDPGPLCPLVDNFNTTIYGQGALDAALGPEIKTGDTQNNVVTFTSSDVQDSAANSWTSVTPLATGETHTSLMGKISQFAKNIRFLYKLLGDTDISGIGSGTVTDILSNLNTNKFDKSHVLNNLTTPASQTGYALDAREGKVLNDNISSLNDAYTSLNSDVKNYKTKNYSRIAYYQESFTFRKQGRFVEVSYAGSSVAQPAQSTYVQLFTDVLESAYRPLGYVYIMMTPANTSGAGSTVLQIRPDGVVNTYNFNHAVTAGLQYRINTVYMAADFS